MNKFLDSTGIKYIWGKIVTRFATKSEIPTKVSELTNDAGYRTTDQKGDTGDTGPYFIPNVDSYGNLSWTNNGGLNNPTSRNIKGPKGDNADGGYETATITGTASNSAITLASQETNYITITLSSDAALGRILNGTINSDSNIQIVSVANDSAVLDANGQLSNGNIRLIICNASSSSITIPANTSYSLTYAKGLAIATLTKINEDLEALGEWETNPEWLRVYKDDDGYLIFGIRTTGEIEWGKGIPTPIKTFVNELITNLSESFAELYGYEVETPEYTRCYVDSNNKIIWGINRTTGGIYFGIIPPQLQSMYDALDARISALEGE